MSEPLNKTAIETALSKLPGWSYEGDKLHREYSFGSFREALSFIVRIGFEAEELGHHPEIFNVYSTVKIGLTTHDAGDKVTELDTQLAERIEHICWL